MRETRDDSYTAWRRFLELQSPPSSSSSARDSVAQRTRSYTVWRSALSPSAACGASTAASRPEQGETPHRPAPSPGSPSVSSSSPASSSILPSSPLPKTKPDRTTPARARANRASAARTRSAAAAEVYAFTGMHHLFASEEGSAVSRVQFAPGVPQLLVYGDRAGYLHLCRSAPLAEKLHTLQVHTRPIRSLEWSQSADLLLSAGADGYCVLLSVRLERGSSANLSATFSTSTSTSTSTSSYIERGELIVVRRLCPGTPESAARCPLDATLFHPLNPNLALVSGPRSRLHIFNLSTGRQLPALSMQAESVPPPTKPPSVLCLCADVAGRRLFVGCSDGRVVVCRLGVGFGEDVAIRRLASVRLCSRPITSLAYRAWHRARYMPELLASCADGQLRLCQVLPSEITPSGVLGFSGLQPVAQLSVIHHKNRVRSCFCPLVGAHTAASCVASGSEDGRILIWDTHHQRPANVLHGHSACVLDVCWNDDESLLVSSDLDGVVILWKRVSMRSANIAVVDQPPLAPVGNEDVDTNEPQPCDADPEQQEPQLQQKANLSGDKKDGVNDGSVEDEDR